MLHWRVQGMKTGWLFDPNSMQSFVRSEPMRRALGWLHTLAGLTWPDHTCNLYHERFVQGKCALTVKWDEQFKIMQR